MASETASGRAARALLIIVGIFSGTAWGVPVSGNEIHGRVVVQGTGVPLAGATLQVRGTDLGSVTDARGYFVLTTPQPVDSLIVSYMGFTTATVPVDGGGENMRIELEPRPISLHAVRVRGQGAARRGVGVTRTTVDVEAEGTPGITQDIVDVVKNQARVAVCAASDLVPDDDTIELRGFSSKRFATAVDGLTVRKTGGRKSTHIVDYALLPLWNVSRVEILPGPHSVLYPGNSEGGVINIITTAPRRRLSKQPTLTLSSAFRSYGTQNQLLRVGGAVGQLAYGLGVTRYRTDGFLRNGGADLRTSFVQLGFSLPEDGSLDAVVTYTDADREIPVVNVPTAAEYDARFPQTPTAAFKPWQEPAWDKEACSVRLHYQQPLARGQLRVVGSWGRENRHRDYLAYVDKTDPTQGTKQVRWETNWQQWGLKIQDEFVPGPHHLLRIGADWTRMDDGYYGDADDKRVDARGLFLQDTWIPGEGLELTGGVRYEDVRIWVSNFAFFSPTPDAPYITTRGPWIKRSWNQYVPKLFATYKLDELSPLLRNTSLSAGVSKIWRAPLSQPEYNPQMRPAGAYLSPEHGVAYDIIAWRRLGRNLAAKIDYSFYVIQDYIAYNRTYAHYTPAPQHPVEPGREYSDYCINLREVHRQGLEMELQGRLTRRLSLTANYAFQEFSNQGTEPAAVDVLDARARHRASLGGRYRYDNTLCMLDWHYEGRKVTHAAQDLGADEWAFHDLPIDAYQVWDVGIRRGMPRSWSLAGSADVTLYVNNLWNAHYQNTDGYPMTDRTFGVSFKMTL